MVFARWSGLPERFAPCPPAFGLLLDLAGAGLLDGFAGFQKTGQGRHPALGPDGLTPQQTARFGAPLIDRQHDDDRIDAREMLDLGGAQESK